jgi:hypothetical protein
MEATMIASGKNATKRRQHASLLFARAIFVLTVSGLVGCGQSTEESESVDYRGLPGDGWRVSTPAEQGLHPMFMAEPYLNAAKLERLDGLLIVKNRRLADNEERKWKTQR